MELELNLAKAVGFSVLFGAVLLVVAFGLWSAIKQIGKGRDGVTGTEDDVVFAEDVAEAVQPYIYRAVLAGERAVLWGFDTIQEKLASTDKQAVAEAAYALLPDVIVVKGVPVSLVELKRIFTAEDFAYYVKQWYEESNAWLTKNEEFFKSKVEAFKTTLN